MTAKKDLLQWFGKSVVWVVVRQYFRKNQIVALDPIHQCKMLDIQMSRAACRLLQVDHGDDCIVVFVQPSHNTRVDAEL